MAIREALRLTGDGAKVEIVPAMGGAVARYDVAIGGDWHPVLAPGTDPSRSGAFALACNVLAPWSNRISGGGFTVDGRFHPLEPNNAGESYPNHGNAYLAAWDVVEADSARAVLTLNSNGPGPFRYDAQLAYALEGTSLSMGLRLTNRADIALPYGGGFHPWFPRTPQTRVRFGAEGVWTETPDHLPDRHLRIDTQPEWDFSELRPLPTTWLNNAFTGWDGTARIEWPEHGLAATIKAAPPLRTLVLYSPSSQSDFVSIEPVTHTVDAHNRSDTGTIYPTSLKPNEAMEMSASIAISTL